MKKNIVFVHGWASTPYIWFYQMDYFKDGYQVWAPELAGHGKKRLCADKPPFECMVADICNMITEKGISDVHLIGWSLGGMVTLEVARRLKKDIKQLVLIGTAPRFIRSEDFALGMSEELILKIQSRLNRSFENTLNWFYRFIFTARERSGEGFKKILNMLGDFMNPLYQEDIVLALNVLLDVDLRSGLKKIDAPTLIIHGDKDPICSPEAATLLHENIKGSRLEFIKDCGHAPFLSQPKVVNDMIAGFIG